MNKYKIIAISWRATRNTFYAILCSVNREHELHRLVNWAQRKRLTQPRHLYEKRLADEEMRLLRYRMRHPKIVSFAYLIHRVTYGVFPPPRYLRRGAASGYNVKNG